MASSLIVPKQYCIQKKKKKKVLVPSCSFEGLNFKQLASFDTLSIVMKNTGSKRKCQD